MTNNLTCRPNSVATELDRVFRAFATPSTISQWRWLEKDEAWVGQIDLPGFAKEEVTVNLDKDRLLVIEAKHSEDDEREFKREAVSYRLRLPNEANAENISGKLENGVLEVIVPKVTPDSQIARRIELN
ncbi:MAG: Hsp20/alpha crystallin family protein [Verrucomicrobiota bacterium JB023]|nr:Hsp20/alpha crystallin family protein [Verrucomicrobiota bacterium JB023]